MRDFPRSSNRASWPEPRKGRDGENRWFARGATGAVADDHSIGPSLVGAEIEQQQGGVRLLKRKIRGRLGREGERIGTMIHCSCPLANRKCLRCCLFYGTC